MTKTLATAAASAGNGLPAVWGSEQVVLPATGAARPVTRRGVEEAAIDLFHHTVYAAATGCGYDWSDAAARRR